MKIKLAIAAAALALFVSVTANAQTKTLTFDTLGSSENNITNGYGGLNWDNFETLDAVNYDLNPSGYLAGMVSSNNVAWSGGEGATISAKRGTVFALRSAYITGAWENGLTVVIKGSLFGKQVYAITNIVNSTNSTFITFPLKAVTSVDFSTIAGVQNPDYEGSGQHFAMDNLKVIIVKP